MRNVLVLAVVRVMGIEPTPQAWEARVLPLNYTRPAVRGGISLTIRRMQPKNPALPCSRLQDIGNLDERDSARKELAVPGRALLAFTRQCGYSLVVKL